MLQFHILSSRGIRAISKNLINYPPHLIQRSFYWQCKSYLEKETRKQGYVHSKILKVQYELAKVSQDLDMPDFPQSPPGKSYKSATVLPKFPSSCKNYNIVTGNLLKVQKTPQFSSHTGMKPARRRPLGTALQLQLIRNIEQRYILSESSVGQGS